MVGPRTRWPGAPPATGRRAGRVKVKVGGGTVPVAGDTDGGRCRKPGERGGVGREIRQGPSGVAIGPALHYIPFDEPFCHRAGTVSEVAPCTFPGCGIGGRRKLPIVLSSCSRTRPIPRSKIAPRRRNAHRARLFRIAHDFVQHRGPPAPHRIALHGTHSPHPTLSDPPESRT